MTKKIFVQKVKGPLIELEVTDNTTVEEARDFLIQNHQFPHGIFKFIYNGTILTNPTPFKSLAEHSKLIVFVKEQQRPANPPQPAPATDPLPTPQHQAPQQAQAQNPSNLPPNRPRPQLAGAPAGGPVRRNLNAEQISQMIQTYVNNSFISRIYDPQCNFWNNPERVSEVTTILQNDIGAQSILDYFLVEHFRPALRYSGASHQIVFTMLGRIPFSQQIMTEYDADVQQMSDAQREAFSRLQQLGVPKDRVLKIYKETGYNEEAARARLTQPEEPK